MLNRQTYSDYLGKKHHAQGWVEESAKFFDHLRDILARSGTEDLPEISEDDIDDFIKSFQWSAVATHKAFDFLSEYASFIRKEQPEMNDISDVITSYCLKKFEASGREAAASRKKSVFLIPDEVKIKPELLGTVSNGQFVSAFREMQKIIIKAYEDIERSPYEWGYPDYYTTDGYYNRVFDFLYAFVCCGCDSEGKLAVATKKFFSFASVKKHKKPELMIAGFEKMGFVFDGLDKRAALFTIAYPEHPHVIVVLNAYIHSLGENALHWSAREMCKWSFSYRYAQDASAQKFETVFHAKMDLASEELRKIQYWLHDEAEKCGFRINASHPYEKGCVQYQRGSKSFLLVGEKDIGGMPTVFSKAIFRDTLISEKEKIMELYARFPDAFKSNCTLCNGSRPADGICPMRICYDIMGKPRRNCAYLSFLFLNPNLSDVIKLLELFKIENKIK